MILKIIGFYKSVHTVCKQIYGIEGKGCFSGVESYAHEVVVQECKSSYLKSGVSFSQ